MNLLSDERNLLTQVGQVVHNYEKNLRVSGNGFSLIQALNLESDESRFHTRLMGYLLNPKAGHFQGEKFLKLFFDQLEIQDSTDGFKVEMEKSIGKKDSNNLEGGRIDILISNQAKKIGYGIEIKIYAGEQPNQLQRYRKFLDESFDREKSKLFYLTLHGDSTNSGFSDYLSISFREHILNWVESARIASIEQPIIRESLTQYTANIKRLTNQNPDNQMSDDIIELITKNENSFKAFEALILAKDRLLLKFGQMFYDSLVDKESLFNGFRIVLSEVKIPNTHSNVSFYLNESGTEKVMIYWLGSGNVGLGLHLGFNPNPDFRNKLRSNLSGVQLGKYLDYPNWAWLSEINELKGQPQPSYNSWQKFQNPDFAEKVASWVVQIADAYKQIVDSGSEIG